MRMLPQEPPFQIYQTGFSGFDRFGREPFGKRLSRLIEDVDDPLVIALDGPWGSGKSTFLKCWVGAHSGENSGKAITVYFNAFQFDYLDDPLSSLTSVIERRLPKKKSIDERWSDVTKEAKKFVLPALRVVLSMASAGASEAVASGLKAGVDAVSAGIEASKDEVQHAAEAHWQREMGRNAAMELFRGAIQRLTTPKDGSPGLKMVIVVDELDRCRPEYAMATMEVIKHMFRARNVHFILGVNADAFGKSLTSKFGADDYGAAYLEKFVDIRLTLSPFSSPGHPFSDSSVLALGQRPFPNFEPYIREISAKMGLVAASVDAICEFLTASPIASQISIRTVQRMLTHMGLTVDEVTKLSLNEQRAYAVLLACKMAIPQLYDYLREIGDYAEAGPFHPAGRDTILSLVNLKGFLGGKFLNMLETNLRPDADLMWISWEFIESLSVLSSDRSALDPPGSRD